MQWILKKSTTMMLLGFWACPQTENKILDNFDEILVKFCVLVTGEMKSTSFVKFSVFFD